MTLDEQLIATERYFYICYHPTLEERNEDDEFDHPAASKHWECEIVVDTEPETPESGVRHILKGLRCLGYA